MNALMTAAVIAAETDKEKFDAAQSSWGAPAFIFTALLAASIILLGFLLTRRLRRNAYRAEVREQIAEELAANNAEAADAADASDDPADGPLPEEGDLGGRDPEQRG